MSELLLNHLGGQWAAGTGAGHTLFDPVLGDALVRVDAAGLDLPVAFERVRRIGGAALRALTYPQRAERLAAASKVLVARRDEYFEIATANSGTVRPDSAVDIDGAAYTLSYFAKQGAALPAQGFLVDGERVALAKGGEFAVQHLLSPTPGLALLINAFNFPAWGLWEKAAPALLSGVPVVVKPATATAWLTQRMVRDIVDAGVLPPGALSVVCGSSDGLLDALQPMDVLSFTGSAETAALVRGHAAVRAHSVRCNVEADSLNSALLLPGEGAGSETFELFVGEVVREMTVKAGQKCTAIRRVLVPQALYGAAADALAARLQRVAVGNPRAADVTMGSLVSRAQLASVRTGLALLQTQAETLHDGAQHTPIDCDPAIACCVGPTLLGTRDADGSDAADRVHDTEVFGPVATLLPYRDLAHAEALVRRGQGALAVSVYGSDSPALAEAALALAPWHGRVHVVSPAARALHTGHGNVMPQSLHGGPGRAGGGEELGGLRALNFYHRRTALQAHADVLGALPSGSAPAG